ncbi:SpoIIE family protein phosphatase [Desulfuribacillus alkaliarsenatis]|uniref:PAS domain-containing protein n=1 Tax=Desulfuribacillus alkaliarsenatis TaxID=766136 RepID=A0A1E5FZ04_9FIRM|nr:SpoIIE family protein phosphatase [Desulfuribacillus alkaliarsenatis]OEF95816.1 hypothetical protein BHF68_10470 [Desulfuribacillus alkaliarsenatis]
MKNNLSIPINEFNEILNEIDNGVMIVDRHGRYLEVNKAMSDRLGYTQSEMRGRSIFELDTPEYAKLAHERLAKIFKEREAVFEVAHKAKDGVIIPAEIKTKVINYNNQDVILVIAKDVSKQKELEEALRVSEEKIFEYIMELELKNVEMEELYRHLDEEIDKALRIHEQTMSKEMPIVEGVSVATYYQPAKKLGGDFYDVIKRENKLVFYVSDVSGHGLDGAIMSMFVKNTISSFVALADDENINPEDILRFLSTQYQIMDYTAEYFISICLMVLNIDSKELLYSSLGFHTPPLVKLNNGDTLTLENKGLPISTAVPTEMLDFKASKIVMQFGSTLLMNTDGLVEQEVADTRYMERLNALFEQMSCLPPKALIQVINNDFNQFNLGRAEAEDDITLLAIKLEEPDVRRKSMIFASDFSALEEVYSWLSTELKNHEDVEMTYMVLQEVIGNAIEHGNRFDTAKKVMLEICVCNNYIFAQVGDEGEGFAWKKQIEKPLTLEGTEERGRGIAMSRLMSEQLFYNEKGNIAYVICKRKVEEIGKDEIC